MKTGERFSVTFMLGALAGKVWGMWPGLLYVCIIFAIGLGWDLIEEHRSWKREVARREQQNLLLHP